MSPDRRPAVASVDGSEPTERADAARNRQAILEAATSLFAPGRVAPVTVDEIAARAGVGKGTVFRRFGDYVGLVEAVIAPRVAALRRAVESGPPPLGPGAPPGEALAAYVDALLDFIWANTSLIRALEHRRDHAYYDNPASQFWIAELCRRLAAAAGRDDAAAGRRHRYMAVALFTNMRADVLDYLESRERMSRARIRAGIQALARAVVTGD